MKKSKNVIKIENFLIMSLATTGYTILATIFAMGIPIKSAVYARNAARNNKSKFSTAYMNHHNERVLRLSEMVIDRIDEMQNYLGHRLNQNQK